jgi:hypothetical protein
MPGDWCYRLGSIVAQPKDLATKAAYLDPNWVRWVVMITFRPSVATRFARLARAGQDQTVAIVSDGTVVAALPMSVSDFEPRLFMNWILDGHWKPAEARRIESALGGRDISSQFAHQTLPTIIGSVPRIPGPPG